MKRAKAALGLGVVTFLLLSLSSCCKPGKKKDQDAGVAQPQYGASIAFRPKLHGYPFRNTGGRYPRTPGLVDTNVMVKLFGADACLAGRATRCRLTPPATEWMKMINRAMNGGQCEGMAVSSLTFFKGVDKAGVIVPGAKSAHDLSHAKVASLIGYYWAFQAVDPVQREVLLGRLRYTPAQVVDRLGQMFRQGELATIGIFAPRPMRGGHAVTPYAIEDRGNGVVWIQIYDNNYPNTERHIEVDTQANTWRYDLAALNPGETKMPWYGTADSRSIVIIPLAARLGKAECPFCRTTRSRRSIFPARSTSLSISDPEGRKLGYEGDKLVNDIPDAEVVNLVAFLPDAAAPEPVVLLPPDIAYDIQIDASKQAKADEDDEDADDDTASVAVFSQGSAIAIGHQKRQAGEADTLSLSGDGSGIKFRSATGKVPSLRMAGDDEKTGYAVRVGNLKADAGDEVELAVDPKKGKITLQGGGKSTDAYDIKLHRMDADDDEDEVVEQKGVKFKLGESHAVSFLGPRSKGGAKAKPRTITIQRGRAPLRPKPPAAGPAGKALGPPGKALGPPGKTPSTTPVRPPPPGPVSPKTPPPPPPAPPAKGAPPTKTPPAKGAPPTPPAKGAPPTPPSKGAPPAPKKP